MAMPDGWIFEGDLDQAPSAIDREPYRYLTTQEQWDNYTNEEANEFELRLRGFLEYMKEHPKYLSAQNRRFTYNMIWERLYGELPKDKKGYKSKTYRKILAYYSTRIMSDTNIGKKRCKKVYVLSWKRLEKRPWCIKNRIQWLIDHGESIEPGRLKVIHKELEHGHARNPRTEANMEKRRERARKAYNAKYNTKAYKEDLQERKQAQASDERRDSDEDLTGDDMGSCSSAGSEVNDSS